MDRRRAAALLCVLAFAACAPKPEVHVEPTRPARVLVRDFVVEAADVTLDPLPLRGNPDPAAADGFRREDAESAQETLAATLVYRLQAVGVPAVRAATAGAAQSGDMILDGRITRIDEGEQENRTKAGAGRAIVTARLRLVMAGPDGTPFEVTTLDGSSAEGGTPGLSAGAAASAIALRSGGVRARELLRASVSAEARRLGNVLTDRMQGYFMQKGWLHSDRPAR